MIRLREAAKPRHPIRRDSILPLPQAQPRRLFERVCAVAIVVVISVAAFDLCSGWL
jgi:hypothetical protein